VSCEPYGPAWLTKGPLSARENRRGERLQKGSCVAINSVLFSLIRQGLRIVSACCSAVNTGLLRGLALDHPTRELEIIVRVPAFQGRKSVFCPEERDFVEVEANGSQSEPGDGTVSRSD